MTRRIALSFVLLVFAFVIQGLYLRGFSAQDQVKLQKPLARFDVDFGDWKGMHIELDDRIVEEAGVTEYVNAVYSKRSANAWFYVGYYDGSTMGSIHQPELCFPGNGWESGDRSTLDVATGTDDVATFNSVLFRKGARARLAAYAFFYEGRFHADQSVVESGRVFGSRHFAVVTVALEFFGPVEAATENIEDLLERAVPRLLDYLPKSEESHDFDAEKIKEND